jgi:hypothetical protein
MEPHEERMDLTMSRVTEIAEYVYDSFLHDLVTNSDLDIEKCICNGILKKKREEIIRDKQFKVELKITCKDLKTSE